MSFDLGGRMKDYENISRIHLTKKLPVIIRLDGKAFHTFTRGFDRPFDGVLMRAMQETAKYLCANIMNCKMAYTQSDEISLLLVDYETRESQPWFENNLQKMVSVSASMSTLAFNKAFQNITGEELDKYIGNDIKDDDKWQAKTDEDHKRFDNYSKKINSAMFDSRAFILPQYEVCNYFIWRQQDATRNSIQMAAQSMFSHKELHGIGCDQLQEKMWQEKNVNWNGYTIPQKRGSCIVKETFEKDGAVRSRWIVDEDIPVFTQERDYIEMFVFNNEI